MCSGPISNGILSIILAPRMVALLATYAVHIRTRLCTTLTTMHLAICLDGGILLKRFLENSISSKERAMLRAGQVVVHLCWWITVDLSDDGGEKGKQLPLLIYNI